MEEFVENIFFYKNTYGNKKKYGRKVSLTLYLNLQANDI